MVGPDATLYVIGYYQGPGFLDQVEEHLFALNELTGGVKWHVKAAAFNTFDVFNYSDAAINIAIGSSGIVYCTSSSRNLGFISAFNSATGAKKWGFKSTTQLADTGQFSPAAIGTGGVVYIRNSSGVYALDGNTGVKKQDFKPKEYTTSLTSLAIGSDGMVYMESAGYVFALNGKTGSEFWGKFISGGELTEPVIGSDGTVYVGSTDGNLYALNSVAGVIKWTFKTAGQVFDSPVIGFDGTIYVSDYNKKIYALDGATGVKKWEWANGYNRILTVGPDGALYTADPKSLYALNSNSLGLAHSSWPKSHSNNQNTGLANVVLPQMMVRDVGQNKVSISMPIQINQSAIIESSTNLVNWAEAQRVSGGSVSSPFVFEVDLDRSSRAMFWRTRFE